MLSVRSSLALATPRRARLLLACIGALAACERAPDAPRSTIVDDFGDTVAVPTAPQRIVSLNPATTQVLYAIGAGRRLVGRTT